jgi:hypothetical protein
MSHRHFTWLALALALFASILGGVLVGEEASAEMNPFYTSAAAQRADRGHAEVVRDDASYRGMETPDYDEARFVQAANGDDGY